MKSKKNIILISIKNTSRKTIGYLKLQLRELQTGGSLIFLRKIRSLFWKIRSLFFVILFLPAILITRILRPFIIIRFGVLRGDRIGHFAGNTEVYLSERDEAKHERNTFDLFYISTPICNDQLKKMWERTLHISKYFEFFNIANLCLPGYKLHQAKSSSSDRDIHNLLVKTPPHLSFTKEEERLGKNGLKKMGLADNEPFICFIGRDSAYLKSVYPDRNMDYHNYRDMDINNISPAINELIQRDYWAIRMGKTVKESFHIADKKYVDYATKFRTDFLDIYLAANCSYFINGMSGFVSVPSHLFRRPILHLNFVPMRYIHFWEKHSICIFKKLWLTEEHRFLTFSEILQSDIGIFLRSEEYKNAEIELIENTSEEIKAATIEIDDRIKGIWETTEEDEELQRRFWGHFQEKDLKFVCQEKSESLIRIGTEFLRQNRELL